MRKPWPVPPPDAPPVTVQCAHREWAEAYCRENGCEVHEAYDAILDFDCEVHRLARCHPDVMDAYVHLLAALVKADPAWATAVQQRLLPRLREHFRPRLVT